MIPTKIDDLIKLLREKKSISIEGAAKAIALDPKSLEKIALVLDKQGIIKLTYPINVIEKPSMRLLDQKKETEDTKPQGNVVDEYQISGLKGHVTGTATILFSEEEKRPMYFVDIPRVSYPTRCYFETLKDEISKLIPIGTVEVSKEDVDRSFEIRHTIIASVLIKDLSPEKKYLDVLCGILYRDMYGLGEIETLIADDQLEEIVLNSSHFPLAVYHRKHGWLKTNIQLKNEQEVENYASQIARKIGKQISLLNPILDAHLLTGDRVNSTLFPVSTHGHSITLRLFARNPWSIVSFLNEKNRVLSSDMAALIWQAVHYEMNALVAGGTASGKTSMLNAVVSLVQPFQRVVSIEDTRELALPKYQWNWVPLVTRAPNPEGLGEITMLDLVVNALRMRPDRIIMGEIRRKKEAEVLFEAMHTGHSVYATMHADTGAQTLKRLIEPPIELPPSEVEDIHLIMIQYRDRRKNLRRTLEISEVVSGPSGPELNRMTEKEVIDDQKTKKAVLEWMLKNRLTQIDDVGAIMKLYYSDYDNLLKSIEKNVSPGKII